VGLPSPPHLIVQILVSWLEKQLQRELHDPRVVRRVDDPEGARLLIEYVSIWLTELCMVERVEELCAELEVHPLSNRGVFEQRNVPVVQSGRCEEAPRRRSQLT
jgi:hypothetical protein